MNGFAVRKQNHPECTSFGLGDARPTANTPVGLYHLFLRRAHHIGDPSFLDGAAVWADTHCEEVCGVFHGDRELGATGAAPSTGRKLGAGLVMPFPYRT